MFVESLHFSVVWSMSFSETGAIDLSIDGVCLPRVSVISQCITFKRVTIHIPGPSKSGGFWTPESPQTQAIYGHLCVRRVLDHLIPLFAKSFARRPSCCLGLRRWEAPNLFPGEVRWSCETCTAGSEE